MNAISEINSWLTTQNVVKNYDGLQAKKVSEKQESSGTNSFLSILKLLDVNGDDSLDTNELKVGLEGFISNFIFERDLDKDLALSAEEAGVSTGVISHLDTNSNHSVNGGEIISEAGRILDGLVSIFDTNGDKILSREELSILELLFSSSPSEVGNQGSNSASVEQELDMDTIPDRMRQAGFQGRDSLLYYVLASTYADWPWQPDPADPDAMKLSEQRGEIYEWYDKIVKDVAKKMDTDPTQTTTAIINDGPDRCGFRLGPAIIEKLKKYGDRVQLGEIYTEA
jgi:hypothetical protein